MATCRKGIVFYLPLIVFLVFTPFSIALDLFLASLFYDISQNSFWHNEPITTFLYNYGEWPALAIGIAATATWIFVNQKKRLILLMMSLTLILGNGLIINGLLKPHWGRPRPKECAEFGGKYSFSPYYQPHFGTFKDRRSFCSGHAGMGFYFFTLYIAGKRLKNRHLQLIGAFIALLFGGALSFTRIAMGGHFFSDAFASFIIIWYLCHFLDWGLHEGANKKAK